MSKRGLLLCNLARQGINSSSSENEVLNKVKQSEVSHKVCEQTFHQATSKYSENDSRVLQWLDCVKETVEQVKQKTVNAEESTKKLKEKTNEDTIDMGKEIIDSAKERNDCVIEGNTTGETFKLGENSIVVNAESDRTDFSGTDSDRDKDFIPEKRRKRKLVSSSSSSSLSSNTSSSSNSSSTSNSSSSSSSSRFSRKSSSSSSKSNKSINLLQTSDPTITQLHTQVSRSIEQQTTSQNSNSEFNLATRSQSECEFQNTPVMSKAKKKARNPGRWKQNIRKTLKNTGQEHTNSSGKIIPAKKIGPPCTEKCLLSCSKRISIEDRQKLFAAYWELGCLMRQRDYVASCITTLVSEYRRVKNHPKFVRKPNSCFYLPLNGDKVRVCKTFLLQTLAITPRFLRHIIDKRTATGSVPPDRRGTLTKKRIDAEIHESVRAHINSIPRIESHYLRAQTTRQYIDGQYTVADLHRLYCEGRKANDKICSTYDFYNRIFNQEFNISFFTPKKDQCDQCVSYDNLSPAEKFTKEDEYRVHLNEKKLSRKEKEADMKLLNEEGNNNLIDAVFDLQAVLPVPIGNSSAFFYKSKLNCYNFTVTDFKNKKTSCFFWHEGLGNRGVNEIGSCVYIFLEELSQKHPNCDVVFYTDNCCGQQKNKFMFNLYYYAVNKLQINSIQHKFLIRGHTQSEADSAHSVIEKAIKRAKKSGPIYVPAQYCQLIRSAKKTGNPFYLKEMNFTDFHNLKSLTEDISLNLTKAENGQAIKITEISQLKFIKDSALYYIKTSYEGDWIEVNRSPTVRRSKRVKEPQEVTLKPAYENKIPLAARKKEDIQNLIDTNIVPKVYETVYATILS